MLKECFLQSWQMIVVSAPWLLFGFFCAGLISVYLPKDFTKRHLKQKGVGSVLKASLIGIPLPLCSCSVIPVGTSLKKNGASSGATASFFVSTPEIGVDSFLISYALLGPLLAVTRLASSFFSALLAGLSIDMFGSNEEETKQQTTSNSCCSKACSKADDESGNPKNNRLLRAIRYGYLDLVDDLAKLLVIGFLIGGCISALVPLELFETGDQHYLVAILLMLVISLPVYVCATSSTPIAAALLAKGLPAGAVLAFLLAGPASNITTILAIKSELGTRSLFFYLISVLGVSFLAAISLHLFIPEVAKIPQSLIQSHLHQQHASPSDITSALILVALLGHSLWRKAK